MKRILVFLLIIIFSVNLLVACNQQKASSNDDNDTEQTNTNTPEETQKEGSKKGPIEVLFWHSMTGNNQETLERGVEEYNNGVGKEEGIEVNAVFQGAYDDASTKLAATIQAGSKTDLPDIMQLSSKGIFDVKDSEYIIPVQEMIDKEPEAIDLDSLNPNALHYAMYNNEVLGLPFSNSSIMIYYNKDHFREAGLDPENFPKTIEELATAVDALTIKSGDEIERYGMGVKLRFFLLGTWIPMQGEDIYIFNNEDGRTGTPTEVAMTKNGALETLLTEWQKVLETGGVEFNDASPIDGFQSELYSIAPLSTSSMATVTTRIIDEGLFDVGVAELPRVNENCTTGTGIGGSALYLFDRGNENSTNGAWSYMKYLATPEASADWFMNTGYYPLNMKAVELPVIQELLEEKLQFKLPFTIVENSANYPKYLEPWVPSFTDMDTTVQNEIIKFSDGSQDLETTINNIDSKCNTLLEDWIRANQ